MLPSVRTACAAVAVLVVSCTSMLGIDGDYQLEQTIDTDASAGAAAGAGGSGGRGSESDGGATSGGRASGGARPGGGGTPASGGATAPEAGTDAPVGCPETCGPGTKCCELGDTGNFSCVAPSPIVGCALDACGECPPPPPEGVTICEGEQCGLRCNDGFVPSDGDCVPDTSGSGGASSGGATGSGGAPVGCDKAHPERTCNGRCLGPFPCCLNDGTCGCTWSPPLCYLPG